MTQGLAQPATAAGHDLVVRLAGLLGAEHVITAAAELQFHAQDVYGSAEPPAAVVRPGTVEQLGASYAVTLRALAAEADSTLWVCRVNGWRHESCPYFAPLQTCPGTGLSTDSPPGGTSGKTRHNPG